MKAALYVICQCTWGILQTLMGLFVFLFHLGDEHFFYHGAIITRWQNASSVSLGLFVFVTQKPFFCQKLQASYSPPELASRLLVHEYGHTIQSLLLGPIYLLAIGVPSMLWGFLPHLRRRRRVGQISYFSFFTERWANALGEKVTGQPSMEQLVID